MIQARRRHVRFTWNSLALQFELHVISQVVCWVTNTAQHWKKKQAEAIEYLSLYSTSAVQVLVVDKFGKKWKFSLNCNKYLLVKLVQKAKVTMQF